MKINNKSINIQVSFMFINKIPAVVKTTKEVLLSVFLKQFTNDKKLIKNRQYTTSSTQLVKNWHRVIGVKANNDDNK